MRVARGAAQPNTLRADIRRVVDQADRRLAQPEIYDKLTRRTSPNSFCVTIAQMLRDRQLSRRKATIAVHAATGARFVYGPGPVLAEDGRVQPIVQRKAMGFMAMKREREGRAVARRRAA